MLQVRQKYQVTIYTLIQDTQIHYHMIRIMTLNLTTVRGNDERIILQSPCGPFQVLPVLLVLFHLPPLNIHAHAAVHQEMSQMLQRQKHVSCRCTGAHRFDKDPCSLPVFSVPLQTQSEAKAPSESSRKTENWDQRPVENVFWNPATWVRVAKKGKGSVSRSTRKPALTNKVWQTYHQRRIKTALCYHQLMCQSEPVKRPAPVSDSSNSPSTA